MVAVARRQYHTGLLLDGLKRSHMVLIKSGRFDEAMSVAEEVCWMAVVDIIVD